MAERKGSPFSLSGDVEDNLSGSFATLSLAT